MPHTRKNIMIVTIIQNRKNFTFISFLTSDPAISRNSITGSATINTYLFATRTNSSVRKPILLNIYPNRIIRKIGIVTFTLNIKLSIVFSSLKKIFFALPSVPHSSTNSKKWRYFPIFFGILNFFKKVVDNHPCFMYNNTCVETRQTNKCLIGVWLSLARAPDLGSGGRRFESCHPDLISSLRQAQIKRV
jgi:hypothetical protein